MTEEQQAWNKEQEDDDQAEEEAEGQEESEKAEQARHNPEQTMPPQLQQPTAQQLHLHTLQALQGHAPLSAADLAALQQHNVLLIQAQQAQQEYENEQRDKGGAVHMVQPESLGLHALAQQGAEQPHDAEYERERKEKRKVANREAARRMRQRRAAQVSGLSLANTDLKAENAALQQQLAHLANHNRELMAENAALRQETLNLKQTLENNRAAGHAVTAAAHQNSAAS